MATSFDREQLPPSKVSGFDTLRHLVKERGMSGADLSRLLNAHRTPGAMILRGERNLTIQHPRRLSEHFGVSPEMFLIE
jgi:antitoxin component HigA of HigAB toxin-antitoxin module